MAELGWDFATKEGFRVFKGLPVPRPPSTPAGPSPSPRRSYVTGPRSGLAPASKSHLIISPEGLPGRVQELYRKLERFMDVHVYPAEQALRDHQVAQSRWTPHPLTEELKVSGEVPQRKAQPQPALSLGQRKKVQSAFQGLL